MIRIGMLLSLATTIVFVSPANADYVHVSYSGSVTQTAPGAPAGIAAGTAVGVDVTYDTAKLVDYTASVNASYGTDFDSLQFVSLSDDPNASLAFHVGTVSFTKFDGINYGTPFGDCPTDPNDPNYCGSQGLGVGNLPAVAYIDGKFAGVANIFINADGFSFDGDPIADLLAGGFGLDGPGEGTDNFYLGKGDVADPFSKGYATGNFDFSTLTISPAAVPEPATWAMLIGGMAMTGLSLRTRRAHRNVAAS